MFYTACITDQSIKGVFLGGFFLVFFDKYFDKIVSYRFHIGIFYKKTIKEPGELEPYDS